MILRMTKNTDLNQAHIRTEGRGRDSVRNIQYFHIPNARFFFQEEKKLVKQIPIKKWAVVGI